MHQPVAPHRHARLPAQALQDWRAALAALQSLEADGFAAALLPCVPDAFEPLTLVAGLVPFTRHIGLVIGIDPEQTPPYTAARRLAALDHASGGRIGWMLPPGLEAPRAADYVAAATALWDSWADGLHRVDRASGRYVDTAGIRPPLHQGPFYRTAGPMDIPRPPQGHPVRYAAAPELLADMQLGADIGRHPASGAAVVAAIPANVPGPCSPGTPDTLRGRLGLPRPARSLDDSATQHTPHAGH
jgi:alkanesulfonate monooxygenase SsuD/methylene tetrahydromethanopterin reductase-like flavin-dependent oxidoreductase (luciferase family)